MIGQQKRSLEHSVSPQPKKYQRHCDDSFCETSTRVASHTGEQLDFEEIFSGVQSKYAPPSPRATGCDATRRHEKGPAHDPSDQPNNQKVSLKVDEETKFNSSYELDSLSDPSAGLEAREQANFSRTEAFCEAKVDHHKDSGIFSADLGHDAEGRGHSVDLIGEDGSELAPLQSAEDFNTAYGDSTQRGELLKNPCKESSFQSGGNEGRGSGQEDEGPSTTNAGEMGVLNSGYGTSPHIEAHLKKATKESSSRSVGTEYGGSWQEYEIPSTVNEDEVVVEGDRAFLDCVKRTVESRRPNGSRPMPVFLSGKVMNLYLMDQQVKAHGGYQGVTSEGLWGKISQTLGFVPECGPGVKLIYFKYLKGLERETSQSLEAQPDATSLAVAQARIGDFAIKSTFDNEKAVKVSPLLGEQFAESELSREKSERTMNVDDFPKVRHSHPFTDHCEDQPEKQITGKRETSRSYSEPRDGGEQGFQPVQSGSAEFAHCISSGVGEDTHAQSSHRQLEKTNADLTAPNFPKREFGKEVVRKSEASARAVSNLLGGNHLPLTSTLIWIKRMALDPGNPNMGEGVEGAGQNEEWVKDCASQAEKLRGLFWKRKDEIRVGEAHLHQVKPTPSHYYEELPRPDQQSIERFRVTRERVAQYGFPGSPGFHRSSQESGHYLQRGPSPQSQSHWSSQRVPRQSSFHSSYSESAYPEYHFTDRPRKRIPVGPDFQAHVPPRKSLDAKSAREMAGIPGDETQSSDDDDEESGRWFGKQVWPPPGFKSPFPEMPVGVGRALTCACLDPQSMDCVRVHVQEERLRLERELGQAFYIWNFDEMGESVSDRWTKEEERTFRALVKMNPPSRDKNFWEQLPDALPGRKMKELVSYYFNVFVLRRRAIQNRLEGRQVDTDDDETELPEGESDNDSEDYDSGDEPDDEDSSEVEDETNQQNNPYRGSEKLLGHTGFSDPGGVNLVYCPTNMDATEAEEDPCGLNLEDEDQGFRSSRLEERAVRFGSAELTSNWSHDQDEEKHLETHVNLVGDDELQEVKTWEDPHWDEANQDESEQDAHVDAAFHGKGEQRALSPSRNKQAGLGDDQRNTLASSTCEVWAETMDTVPRKVGDKLLSTNGMIQELFGDECPDGNSPS